MPREASASPAGVGEWTRLAVGHKRRDVSAKLHRVGADGRTCCGFAIGDREVPGPGPPGSRRCLICSLTEAGP